MGSKASNQENLQSTTEELKEMSARWRINEIFAERRGSYVNGTTLFIALFNSIPNFVQEIYIDCEKANTWFISTYRNDIKDQYFNKRYFNQSKKAEYDDIFYITSVAL